MKTSPSNSNSASPKNRCPRRRLVVRKKIRSVKRNRRSLVIGIKVRGSDLFGGSVSNDKGRVTQIRRSGRIGYQTFSVRSFGSFGSPAERFLRRQGLLPASAKKPPDLARFLNCPWKSPAPIKPGRATKLIPKLLWYEEQRSQEKSHS